MCGNLVSCHPPPPTLRHVIFVVDLSLAPIRESRRQIRTPQYGSVASANRLVGLKPTEPAGPIPGTKRNESRSDNFLRPWRSLGAPLGRCLPSLIPPSQPDIISRISATPKITVPTSHKHMLRRTRAPHPQSRAPETASLMAQPRIPSHPVPVPHLYLTFHHMALISQSHSLTALRAHTRPAKHGSRVPRFLHLTTF
jgi:hypothetical protein